MWYVNRIFRTSSTTVTYLILQIRSIEHYDAHPESLHWGSPTGFAVAIVEHFQLFFCSFLLHLVDLSKNVNEKLLTTLFIVSLSEIYIETMDKRFAYVPPIGKIKQITLTNDRKSSQYSAYLLYRSLWDYSTLKISSKSTIDIDTAFIKLIVL